MNEESILCADCLPCLGDGLYSILQIHLQLVHWYIPWLSFKKLSSQLDKVSGMNFTLRGEG
jgi:hypothetical protein